MLPIAFTPLIMPGRAERETQGPRQPQPGHCDQSHI